jgi:hypothetical protein
VSPSVRFASRVFRWAGIYGLVTLLPQYALEGQVGLDYPPPITHPEYFYGFVGLALAWQLAFLVIARDPVRHRPLMLVGVVEKLSFGLAAVALFAAGRLATAVLVFGAIDLLLAVLFAHAFRATGRAHA